MYVSLLIVPRIVAYKQFFTVFHAGRKTSELNFNPPADYRRIYFHRINESNFSAKSTILTWLPHVQKHKYIPSTAHEHQLVLPVCAASGMVMK